MATDQVLDISHSGFLVSALQGAMLAMGFAVLLVLLLSRRSQFLWLGLFIFTQVFAQGFWLAQLEPPKWRTDEIIEWWVLFDSISFVAAILFTRQLLLPDKNKVFFDKAAYIPIALCLSFGFLLGHMHTNTWTGFITLLSLYHCWICYRNKKTVVAGLLVGWGTLVAFYGTTAYALNDHSVTFAAQLALLMTIAAVMVSSFWLTAALKQYIEHKKTMVAEQQKALAEAKAHEAMQEQLLEVEEQAREEIEAKFLERTFELEVTLRELQDANRELEEKNTQDALTGIRNRRFFDKKYQAEFRRSRREQTELSLVILDIDFFKKVNDNYGHLAGDDVIRFVGRTIADMLKRPSDEACRYGGEEFALILPSTNAEGAIKLAEMLRQQIQDSTINTDAGPIQVTVSCGVYTATAELEMNQNQYIELADKALYHAKQTGRNRVVHYAKVPSSADSQ